MELDCTPWNNHWREAELAEFNTIYEYGTFCDMGIATKPKEYKNIRYQIQYCVKHDLHRNARLVADRNLTKPPTSSA